MNSLNLGCANVYPDVTIMYKKPIFKFRTFAVVTFPDMDYIKFFGMCDLFHLGRRMNFDFMDTNTKSKLFDKIWDYDISELEVEMF